MAEGWVAAVCAAWSAASVMVAEVMAQSPTLHPPAHFLHPPAKAAAWVASLTVDFKFTKNIHNKVCISCGVKTDIKTLSPDDSR